MMIMIRAQKISNIVNQVFGTIDLYANHGFFISLQDQISWKKSI